MKTALARTEDRHMNLRDSREMSMKEEVVVVLMASTLGLTSGAATSSLMHGHAVPERGELLAPVAVATVVTVASYLAYSYARHRGVIR